MASPHVSVLSLHGVSLQGRHAGALELDLAHREVALVELGDESDAAGVIDICLGMIEPLRGDVHCLGRPWRGQSYREMLAHRRLIGTLVDAQVWPASAPVAEVVLTARLYHTDQPEEAAVAAATLLARRFGLAGLPVGGRESVPPGELTRAACVRAFLGAPEFVLIADPSVEAMGELGVALAQSIGAVQDRGGAVLWLMSSIAAPAARFVAADHVLRLDDRGLAPVRRRA
jgi:phospholipid/cholesterol/gamma-HCH transport system ATP-binding protein